MDGPISSATTSTIIALLVGLAAGGWIGVEAFGQAGAECSCRYGKLVALCGQHDASASQPHLNIYMSRLLQIMPEVDTKVLHCQMIPSCAYGVLFPLVKVRRSLR